ncbi:hypothetical protein [Paenibacillus pasadenensis]|nr:hypothetical protein [Paenibacillus pasadenensis]
METCKTIEKELSKQGIEIGDLDFEIAKLEAELSQYLGNEGNNHG